MQIILGPRGHDCTVGNVVATEGGGPELLQAPASERPTHCEGVEHKVLGGRVQHARPAAWAENRGHPVRVAAHCRDPLALLLNIMMG